MRLTVLGGCGAWPAAGRACSGYLVEHDGFRLLLDPGYAVLPRLLGQVAADDVDAVFVTHGHPDHCVDLNPLLRARVLDAGTVSPLPVFAPPGALDAVLALDRPGLLEPGLDLRLTTPGDELRIGPFGVVTALLPHSLPNAGVRLSAAGAALVYTGDSGPADAKVELARDADLLLAEASFAEAVPSDTDGTLSSAAQVGHEASIAGVRRLVLTHLLEGTGPDEARVAASRTYGDGLIDVAREGLVVDVGS